ncbi:MAG: hypothetical protein ACD_41C00220G0008, partial [uncultured bacterium]
MRKYSPNLKPTQQHNHADAAERLGVPQSNILDLRKHSPVSVEPETMVEIAPEVAESVQPMIISDTPEVPEEPKSEEPTVEPKILAQPVPPQAKFKRPIRQWQFAWKPTLAFAVVAGL